VITYDLHHSLGDPALWLLYERPLCDFVLS
jgi:hypothetical protein